MEIVGQRIRPVKSVVIMVPVKEVTMDMVQVKEPTARKIMMVLRADMEILVRKQDIPLPLTEIFTEIIFSMIFLVDPVVVVGNTKGVVPVEVPSN